MKLIAAKHTYNYNISKSKLSIEYSVQPTNRLHDTCTAIYGHKYIHCQLHDRVHVFVLNFYSIFLGRSSSVATLTAGDGAFPANRGFACWVSGWW